MKDNVMRKVGNKLDLETRLIFKSVMNEDKETQSEKSEQTHSHMS